MNVFFGNASANQTNNALSFEDRATLALIRANITSANWENVKLLDQPVSTTSNTQFNQCTLTSALRLQNGTKNISLQAPTLTANRTITIPDADTVLSSQAVNTNNTVSFYRVTAEDLNSNGDTNTINCNVKNRLNIYGGPSCYTIISAPTLTGYRNINLPDASINLTQFSGPNQDVSINASPQFSTLGIGKAAGTEALEVFGNIKLSGLLISTSSVQTFKPVTGSGTWIFDQAWCEYTRTGNMYTIAFYVHWSEQPAVGGGDYAEIQVTNSAITNILANMGNCVYYSQQNGLRSLEAFALDAGLKLAFKFNDESQTVLQGMHINGCYPGYIKGVVTVIVNY